MGVRRLHGPALAPILFVMLAVSDASAAGVGLRWNACVADGGVINRSFACNTNTGAVFLVSSFVLDQPIALVRRADVSLSLAASSPELPAWWELDGCRFGARTAQSAGSVTPVLCARYLGTGGINGIVIGERGPNTERIELGAASGPSGADVGAGREYVTVVLRLSMGWTVGDGSCAGCEIPVCIVVRAVSFFRVLGSPPDLVLTQPLNGTDSNFATWQGGGSPAVGGAVGCPAATRVRRSVWGALKALYR